MALSTVVALPILSICPDSGNEFVALLRNSTLYPREKACQNSNILNHFGLFLQITRVLALLGQTILCLWF